MIRRETYQSASDNSRWSYEPVPDLWPDIDHDIDSSEYESSNEVSNYQEKPDDNEQE